MVGGGKAVTGPAEEGVVGSAKRAAMREWVEVSVSWSRWGSSSAYAAGSVEELSNAARRAGSVTTGLARGSMAVALRVSVAIGLGRLTCCQCTLGARGRRPWCIVEMDV